MSVNNRGTIVFNLSIRRDHPSYDVSFSIPKIQPYKRKVILMKQRVKCILETVRLCFFFLRVYEYIKTTMLPCLINEALSIQYDPTFRTCVPFIRDKH